VQNWKNRNEKKSACLPTGESELDLCDNKPLNLIGARIEYKQSVCKADLTTAHAGIAPCRTCPDSYVVLPLS